MADATKKMTPFILSAAFESRLRRAGARRRAELRYFRLYMQRNQTMNASSLIAGKARPRRHFIVVRSPHTGGGSRPGSGGLASGRGGGGGSGARIPRTPDAL